ncbi:ABC transporter permease [Sphaerisporangium fuscum]|uniref:ABC transporter permease n=1 Tax=Sphaerisporangium fuscum TaxID=2835868 RepID=UPI001BDC8C43|nr:ABC transporter permease [Sphaerisporangium fuscum]
MRPYLRAEWTKLRTLAGAFWLPLAVVALTVAVSAAASATVHCRPDSCDIDAPKLGLMGVQAGQALVAILAVLVVTGEYGTGMIRATLAAMPRRGAVLAAKAAVVSGVTLAAAIPAVLGSLLAGRLILPGNGFTPEHGYPPLSLTDGPTLRAAAGSVLYLVLIALIGLGVATAVRDSATSVGVVLGLLYAMSALPFLIHDPDWQPLLWRLSPMNAGLSVQATTHLSELPITPWAGLGVVAAWAAAALAGGGLLLRLRDA